MTDSELIEQFNTLSDENLNETLQIQLANNAKNRLEREMKLEICKRLDESNTAASGQTYTTAITLPSGFRGLARDFILVGTSKRYPKPYEESPIWRTVGGFFYINHGAGTLHLTGTQGSAATIAIPYIKGTPNITLASIAAGTRTLTWPTEPDDFDSLIPYEMCKLLDQLERGEKVRSWRAEWNDEYNLLKNVMRDWDADLKLAALGGQTPYGPEQSSSGEYQIDI